MNDRNTTRAAGAAGRPAQAPGRQRSPSPEVSGEDITPLPGYTRPAPRVRPWRRQPSQGSWGVGIPPRQRLSGLNDRLLHRYHVHEAEEAAQLFEAKNYRACLDVCVGILAHDCATEAIMARIHMMVTTPEIHFYLQNDRM